MPVYGQVYSLWRKVELRQDECSPQRSGTAGGVQYDLLSEIKSVSLYAGFRAFVRFIVKGGTKDEKHSEIINLRGVPGGRALRL